MSILTNSDIREILCTNEEHWDSNDQLLIQDFQEECLTPMGYDLRVGGFYKTFVTRSNFFIPETNLFVLDKDNCEVLIEPRDIALIGTCEKIRMPRNGSISALILSKVSKVAKGLSHISTKVDPGWSEGELLVPVQNFSRETVTLSHKEQFCTIIFFQNKSAPSSLYDVNTSRGKFVKLLATTSQNRWSRDITLGSVSVFVYVFAFVAGYKFFGNSAGLSTCVAFGIAFEKIISAILARLI